MLESKNYEFARVFFHIGASLIVVWLFNYVKPTAATLIIFLAILLIEYLRLKNYEINQILTNHKRSFLAKIFRAEEVDNFSAALIASLGFLLISWLPLHLLKTAILINGFADPAARIFGIKWGRKKILNTSNSWIGSSVFFIVAYIVGVLFVAPITALAVAAVSTVAEFLPDKKPFWVDNLRIPVFTGLILWILTKI